jgi:hypothetical protein
MKFNLIILFLLILFSATLFAEESSYGYFSQKAGMNPVGSHSVYFRTNDEFTGFSTLLIGYRYGLTEYFQFSLEGGIGINTYIGSIVLHHKFFETRNQSFFIGLRNRIGFKYQDVYIKLGNAVLDDERTGIFNAIDFTLAWRLGEDKRHAIYYSLYPFFDIDVTGRPVEIYFSPIHFGYEFRFRNNPKWSFAIEAGYFLAVNDVPETSWFNFPNLANIGFYYRSR